MQNITLNNITQAVVNHGDRGQSHPRLQEIYASLVQHLHDFVREVNLTESELQLGRDFLNRVATPKPFSNKDSHLFYCTPVVDLSRCDRGADLRWHFCITSGSKIDSQ